MGTAKVGVLTYLTLFGDNVNLLTNGKAFGMPHTLDESMCC